MNHWLDLVVVLLFIVVLFFLWKTGQKKKVYNIVYFLVCEAERIYGQQVGSVKYNYVYQKLPFIVKLFFSEAQITVLINKCLEDLKEYLVKSGGILLPKQL